MDTWKYSQLARVAVSGNKQAKQYWKSRGLSTYDKIDSKYTSRAALAYKADIDSLVAEETRKGFPCITNITSGAGPQSAAPAKVTESVDPLAAFLNSSSTPQVAKPAPAPTPTTTNPNPPAPNRSASDTTGYKSAYSSGSASKSSGGSPIGTFKSSSTENTASPIGNFNARKSSGSSGMGGAKRVPGGAAAGEDPLAAMVAGMQKTSVSKPAPAAPTTLTPSFVAVQQATPVQQQAASSSPAEKPKASKPDNHDSDDWFDNFDKPAPKASLAQLQSTASPAPNSNGSGYTSSYTGQRSSGSGGSRSGLIGAKPAARKSSKGLGAKKLSAPVDFSAPPPASAVEVAQKQAEEQQAAAEAADDDFWSSNNTSSKFSYNPDKPKKPATDTPPSPQRQMSAPAPYNSGWGNTNNGFGGNGHNGNGYGGNGYGGRNEESNSSATSKFAGAKAISSDTFFGKSDAEQAMEDEERRQRLSGMRAISSDDFYGRSSNQSADDETYTNGLLSKVSNTAVEGLSTGVSKSVDGAKVIGSLAKNWVSDVAERYNSSKSVGR